MMNNTNEKQLIDCFGGKINFNQGFELILID